MKRTMLGLLVAVSLAGAGATVGPASVAVAKPCSAGWKHGVIGGAHKCLKRGQFCAKRHDRTYHRYGFHCHTGRLR